MGWLVQGLNTSEGRRFSSKSTTRPIQHPIQWALGLFPGGAEHPLLSSARVNYGVQLYVCLPPSVPAWHASYFKLFVMYRVTGVSQISSVSAVTRLHAG